MTYSRTGDIVTLAMDVSDYCQLMMVFGFVLAKTPAREERRWLISFLNNLNADNPEYRPYGLPGEPS